MLGIQDFGRAAGQAFSLDMGASTITLMLDKVDPLPTHVYPGMSRTPFSLLFRSSSAVVLPQRIYTLRNEAVGAVGIFLVPVARDKDGITYQAVFN